MIFSGNAEKGVPDFWLTAMKTNEILAGEVTIFYKLWSILDIPHSFGTKGSLLYIVLIVELWYAVPLD